MSDVTRILDALSRGEPQAAGELLPLVYDELRRLAAVGWPGEARADARRHGPGPRGLPAAGRRRPRPAVAGPRPFLRRRGRGDAAHPGRERPAQAALKHGGGRPEPRSSPTRSPRRKADRRRPARPRRGPRPARRGRPAAAELVKLRFFAGLSIAEAAEVLGHLAAHRRPALGLCPRLAPPRDRARVAPRRSRSGNILGVSSARTSH